MNQLIKHSLILLISTIFLGYTTPSEKITLRVGYMPVLDHLPLLISHAHHQCDFQQIEIKVKMFKAWREIAGALKAGAIDAAFLLSPLAMDLFNQGVDIKTILLAHRDGAAITVKHDLAITSAADLKGKVIAIPDRKATHVALLNQYLMTAKLSLQDVIPKVIAPPNMLKAMKLGKIDAFIVAEPFGAKAQQDGVGKLLTLSKDILPHHIDCIVVIRQTLIANHRDAIQEWIDSLIEAGQWLEQDKLANGSKQTAQLVSQKYLPHSIPTIIMGLQSPPQRISFADLNPSLADFQTTVKISKEASLINEINLEAFIENSFYQNAHSLVKKGN
jgi:NitT/TauT family transport system substrate-binding protein